MGSLWIFVIMMLVYGALSILFAFVRAPDAVSSLFKVPSIFVFLPDKYIIPAGRVFVGLCSLLVAVGVAYRVLAN